MQTAIPKAIMSPLDRLQLIVWPMETRFLLLLPNILTDNLLWKRMTPVRHLSFRFLPFHYIVQPKVLPGIQPYLVTFRVRNLKGPIANPNQFPQV